MNRRQFALSALSPVLLGQVVWAAPETVVVYKSPTCGCCTAWVAHMNDAGFDVDTKDIAQERLWALKGETGITPELSACHTAFVDGYFIEGHVPASDVRRLLATRPDARGLTVPGMPVGSPGMEMGDQRESYETLLVRIDGSTETFSHHT